MVGKRLEFPLEMIWNVGDFWQTAILMLQANVFFPRFLREKKQTIPLFPTWPAYSLFIVLTRGNMR